VNGEGSTGDSAQLLHAVLVRVAELVRRLPADQLRALAKGDATLQVVPRQRTWAPPPPAAPGPPEPARRAIPPLPVDEIRATLVTAEDRASATAYLDGLRLSAAQLRALAKELGVAVAATASKSAIRDTLVHWTVGRRLDSAALVRPAPRHLS
jgi:hypothetical protein